MGFTQSQSCFSDLTVRVSRRRCGVTQCSLGLTGGSREALYCNWIHAVIFEVFPFSQLCQGGFAGKCLGCNCCFFVCLFVLLVCLLCLLVCWFGFMLVLLLCLFVSLFLYLFVGGVWFGPVDSRCSLGVVGVGMAPFIPHCAVHPSRVNYGTWRSLVCYHLHSYQSTPSLFLLFLFFPPKELLLLHHTVIHSWFQILGYGMICLQFTSNPFWVNWNQPGQSLKSKCFFFISLNHRGHSSPDLSGH